MNPARANTAVFHLGRIGLASLFVLGGLNKISDPTPAVMDMEAIGILSPALFVIVVIAAELGLGMVLAAGNWLWRGRFVWVSASLLLIHTAVINVMLHAFWLMNGPDADVELSLFFKNLSIMGGLAMVSALYSRGTCRARREIRA